MNDTYFTNNPFVKLPNFLKIRGDNANFTRVPEFSRKRQMLFLNNKLTIKFELCKHKKKYNSNFTDV